MIDLALQENGWLHRHARIQPQEPPGVLPEERKALGIFSFQEKGPPKISEATTAPCPPRPLKFLFQSFIAPVLE